MSYKCDGKSLTIVGLCVGESVGLVVGERVGLGGGQDWHTFVEVGSVVMGHPE